MKVSAICFVAFLLFAALPAQSQSPDTASPPPNPAKPADAPAESQTNPSTEKKKPKKVWTNDEISSVKGGVSVVGDSTTSSPKPGEKRSTSASGATDARRAQIEQYRQKIQQIQAQMDAIDARIAQLKNFHGNNTSPSGGINPYEGYNMVPVEDQIKQLEEKKKQLQAKIDDIENEARKNGIESGELR